MSVRRYVIARRDKGAEWFHTGLANAAGDPRWSPNIRNSVPLESPRLLSGEYCVEVSVDESGQIQRTVPVVPEVEPFFDAVRRITREVAVKAADGLGVEITGEPAESRPDGPLRDYRAEWLFPVVFYGGQRSQLQVRVETRLEGEEEEAGLAVVARAPYSACSARFDLRPYLLKWRATLRRQADGWAGVHGRSGQCSCPNCRDAVAAGEIPSREIVGEWGI